MCEFTEHLYRKRAPDFSWIWTQHPSPNRRDGGFETIAQVPRKRGHGLQAKKWHLFALLIKE